MAQDSEKRSILVTSALPYANASLHLGHILEHTQTDIWVRFQKLYGNECIYVCADDAHGTPIMLSTKNIRVLLKILIFHMIIIIQHIVVKTKFFLREYINLCMQKAL